MTAGSTDVTEPLRGSVHDVVGDEVAAALERRVCGLVLGRVGSADPFGSPGIAARYGGGAEPRRQHGCDHGAASDPADERAQMLHRHVTVTRTITDLHHGPAPLRHRNDRNVVRVDPT